MSKLQETEHELLSEYMLFFPKSSEPRQAQLIDVPVGSGNHIHELYIENDSSLAADDPRAKHIVIVHGFGASLGFFFRNFEGMSKIPGAKLHFLDLLGFGLSSRPKFPKFNPKVSKSKDLEVCEGFFIDPLEAWRQQRKVELLVLIGHSLGGYLSFAYSLKYPDHLEKLILVSPVGVERSVHSAEANVAEDYVEAQIERALESEALTEEDLKKGSEARKELTGENPKKGSNVGQLHTKNDTVDELDSGEQPRAGVKRTRLLEYIWKNHIIDPLTPIRFAGPFGSKIISRWTKRRFADSLKSEKEFMLLHMYVYYSITGVEKSGESCVTRVLGPGALAYFPVLDRLPEVPEDIEKRPYHKAHFGGKEKSILKNIPVMFMYGDKDWMNEEAGEAAVKRINSLHKQMYGEEDFARYVMVEKAGHHIYLDNDKEFLKEIVLFLGNWLD